MELIRKSAQRDAARGACVRYPLRTADVTIWGRKPPPIGGVTHSVAGLERALIAKGLTVVVVDYSRPRPSGLQLLASAYRGVHVFNVSSPRTFRLFGIIATLCGGNRIALLHGGELRTTLSASRANRCLAKRFTQIWATNATLAEAGRSLRPHDEVRVVSPYSGSPTPSRVPNRDADLFVVFAYQGSPIYGVDVCLDAIQLIRMSGRHAAELTVVVYGRHREAAWEATQRRCSQLEWVNIREELTEPDVDALLLVATLLRPSSTDGDSLIIRRALELGARVIASDAAPRPAGVELTRRDPTSLAHAIEEGGEVSSGRGLGERLDEAVLGVLRRR